MYTKDKSEFKNKIKGLTEEEVIEKRKKCGYNELSQKKKKTILNMIFEQLSDAMIIILFVAAIVLYLLSEKAEAIVIFVIIIINIIISVFQEKKAENAVELLKSMNAPNVKVLRDGIRKIISAKELVIDDIVFIEDGDIVPADLRLLETSRLQIAEASLTGESVPVYKDENIVLDENTLLGDRVNMAYSSTIVTYGSGMGIVVAIGMDTEVGKIANMLENADELDTPLKQKLNKIGKILSLFGIIVSIIVFIIGL